MKASSSLPPKSSISFQNSVEIKAGSADSTKTFDEPHN